MDGIAKGQILPYPTWDGTQQKDDRMNTSQVSAFSYTRAYLENQHQNRLQEAAGKKGASTGGTESQAAASSGDVASITDEAQRLAASGEGAITDESLDPREAYKEKARSLETGIEELDFDEIMFGMMERYHEESLESAERTSEKHKKETQRLDDARRERAAAKDAETDEQGGATGEPVPAGDRGITAAGEDNGTQAHSSAVAYGKKGGSAFPHTGSTSRFSNSV